MAGRPSGLSWLARSSVHTVQTSGMLPVQFTVAPLAREQDGARALYAAMIERALDDVRKYRTHYQTSESARRLVERGLGWLVDETVQPVGGGLTFRQCCDGLGLDGDLIIAELRRFLRTDTATYRRRFGASSFAEAVRVYRRRLSLTQAELARRLGCAPRDVSHYEQGTAPPPAVRVLAHALGMF